MTMKKSILIKLIADDLINYPLSGDQVISFETDSYHGKDITYVKHLNQWCFSGWRSNNFFDGYWDYVYSHNLENFLYKLSNKELLHLREVRGIIYREDVA